jgi:HK97 family phage portal protein
MSLRTKTAQLARKAFSLVSTPFRLSDSVSYRAANDETVGRAITGAVDPETAMRLSVVFACVKLISETVATLPLLLYRRKNGGGREVAADHPLYSILHDSPNADQTSVEFWEEVIAYIALRGVAYIAKGVDANDNVFELRALHPDRMGGRRLLPAGSYVYTYNHPTRGWIDIPERLIWVQKGFGGLSVVQYGASSMSGALAAEASASKLYGNDMKPTAVISREEFLTNEQRKQAKAAIADGMMRPIDGGGAIRLLEGGMKYQQLSMTPEDAQLLETRQYSVEDLCRWFGMNPAMIGHGTSVSNWGTGREQINLAFLQYVLRAYTKRIEQGIAKWLIKPEERRRLYAEYSVEGLLRADSAGRAAFYSTMVQNGIMTRNEVRDLENLPTMDGGDDLTVQTNLAPISLLGQGIAPAADAIEALKRALGAEDKTHAT